MATYGGKLSLERFLVFESSPPVATGAAFTAGTAHRSGRPRLRGGAATLLALLALTAIVAPSPAQAADTDRAARWLASAQNADGGWGDSPGDDSSASTTAWVALGLAAAGRNPLDVARLGRTPIDYLRGNVDELGSAGDFALTMLALEAAGVDPRSFGGHDLLATLRDKRADNGSWVGWPGSTAFAVIALRAAGASGGLDRSLSWLAKVQNGDGGWGDVPRSFSTADGTGAAMQAMPDTEAAQRGFGYLRRHQRHSGGFVTGASGAVNSQSTAWAVQGMLAIGADPGSVRSGGASALDYLAARQAADGHYRYSASSDQTPVWVTGQVLTAVAGESFPIAPPPRKAAPPSDDSGSKSDSPSRTPSGGVASGPAAKDLLESLRKGGGEPGGAGAAPTPPPASGGVPALPAPPAGTVPEGDAPETAPTAPPAEPFAASAPPSPSPLPPVGIGLATASLAIAIPWWLGRRNGW